MFKFLEKIPNKTYGASLIAIIVGAAQLIGYAPEMLDTTVSGWELIIGGLLGFGFGHKIEKLIRVFAAVVEVTKKDSKK